MREVLQFLIMGSFCLLVGGGFAALIYVSARQQFKKFGIKDLRHMQQLAKAPPQAMQATVDAAVREQHEPVEVMQPGHSPRSRLEQLREVGLRGDAGVLQPFDPDFSPVVFEDFAHALFTRVHEARGGGRLDRVGAWLSDDAFEALRALGRPAQVKDPLVGVLAYEDVTGVAENSSRVQVSLRFEAHYAEVDAVGAEQPWYVREAWTLERSPAVASRSPDTVGTFVFTCPNCGAPSEAQRGGTCYRCDTKVNTGGFDWVVQSVRLLAREQRAPRGIGPPRTRDPKLPTLRDARAEANLDALGREDPDFILLALRPRLELILQEVRAGASHPDGQGMRPFLGDNVFRSQRHGSQASRDAGVRHVTRRSAIQHVSLARMSRDTYYDALTVRVHATCVDYSVRESDQKLVAGSAEHPRDFSEYWTLVRRRGVKGAPGTTRTCPSCGKPLTVDAAGYCMSCQAHLTSGAFDWVLHRIEQDASYRG